MAESLTSKTTRGADKGTSSRLRGEVGGVNHDVIGGPGSSLRATTWAKGSPIVTGKP